MRGQPFFNQIQQKHFLLFYVCSLQLYFNQQQDFYTIISSQFT